VGRSRSNDSLISTREPRDLSEIRIVILRIGRSQSSAPPRDLSETTSRGSRVASSAEEARMITRVTKRRSGVSSQPNGSAVSIVPITGMSAELSGPSGSVFRPVLYSLNDATFARVTLRCPLLDH